MVVFTLIPWSGFELTELSAALASGSLAFVLYWFVSISEKLATGYFGNGGLRNFNFVIFSKYFGFAVFFLACIACAMLFPESLSFNMYFAQGNLVQSIYWILGMGVPLIIAAWFSGANPIIQAKYPEAKLEYWSASQATKFALAWLFYLLGYELLFRGLWFIGLVPVLGFWPAIFLNVSLYSITHIPKGPDEAIAAIPVGFLLCLATYSTGSVWSAVCIHVLMAWSGNYFAWKRVSKNT